MAKRKKGLGDTSDTAKDDGNHFGSFALKRGKKAGQDSAEGEQVPTKGKIPGNEARGPFPGHMRPHEAECRAARDSLALLHGEPAPTESKLSEKRTVLDSLVQTILSQNTTDTNSSRTFANLKNSFGSWDAVLAAPSKDVEAAIKLGGLAEIKTARIKDILSRLMEERGKCSMEYLRDLPDEAIKADLTRYKGVGPKTVACVLMFCLDRFEFPVDTHVWRITKNLGWVPPKASREDTYEHLNTRIPDDIKFDLHVLLVEHGKRCARCAKNGKPRKEAHGPCPLVNLATVASKGGRLNAKAAAADADRAIKDEPEALELRPQDLKQEKGGKLSAKAAAADADRAFKDEPGRLDLRPEDLKQEVGVKAEAGGCKGEINGTREVKRRVKEELEDASLKVEIKEEA